MRAGLSAGLVAACDDPQLFGVPLTLDQRTRLTAVEAGPRTHIWNIGRRGLKTTSESYVGLWCCLLRPELLSHLRPGERGYAVGVATNLRQARLLVQSALAVVERSPLLVPLVESVSEDEIRFHNSTAFTAFPCTSRGGRGWPIFALLLDEFAHMLDNEGNVAAESVLRALLPSTATFGADARVIVSSTPWGSSGAFAEMYEKAAAGELPDAVTHRATTAQANPSVPPEFLAAEERRDPEGFRAEYLAEFVGSGGAFLDAQNVAACVTLEGDLEPGDAVDWVAGLDPAFSSDPFGLVLVGRDPRDNRRLIVGKVRSWEPPRRRAAAFSLEASREVEDAVLAEVAQVLRHFDARAVTDQYRSAGVTERLRRYGCHVRAEPMTAPTKDAAWGFLRGRINEGGIELPEHPPLQRELRAARTRYAAGRSSVVLPRIGGSHCDLAQALALAVYDHDRRSLDAGMTISVPSGQIRTRRFLHEADEAALPFPHAEARGEHAKERLAAMRRSAGIPLTTRWEPGIRE